MPNLALRAISIRADRLRLAKRRWRGVAENGIEFGFELESPLKHGETVHEADGNRYVIEQEAEAVLEISLASVTPAAAAGIGWAIGNLHLDLSADEQRMLTVDDVAARQLLERLSVAFTPTTAVFRPGRFVRGAVAAERTMDFGSGHRH